MPEPICILLTQGSGKPGHSNWQTLGMDRSWSNRRKKVNKVGPYSRFSDPAPVQVLVVKSGGLDADVPSVPSSATIRIYFQFLPHENVPDLIQQIRSSLKKFELADPFFRAHPIQWKTVVDPPAFWAPTANQPSMDAMHD